MDTINIVIVGDIAPSITEMIRNELERVFAYRFRVYARIPLPEKCYMEDRGQYNAACILEQLLKYPGYRVVGIVSRDIAYPEFNFLLGLASADGHACLISVYRLQHENTHRYMERIKKEIMHELGHTFGLKHCKNECVMRFSNTVFESDIKPAKFCDECACKIKEHLR